MSIPKGGIAFFDSGIGGLTVLHECVKRLPDERFYYYGDNAHAPYGNLAAEQIEEYTFAAFDGFAALDVKAAVIACNTVTAVCVEKLRRRYAFPIVGAEPAVALATKAGGEIFVLATVATCQSPRFISLCKRTEEKYPRARLVIHSCPDLAGEIEKHLGDSDFDISIHIPTGSPSAVVLGCTHYIYIKERLERYYSCPVIDGNLGISTRLSTLLQTEIKGDLSTKNGVFIHSCQQSRDCRPLFSTALNTNECLQKSSEIYFLGDQKSKNEEIFKQMFAIPENKRD